MYMDRGRWYRLERYYPDEELDEDTDEELYEDTDEELDEDEEMNGNEGDIQPQPLAQQVEGGYRNEPFYPGARRQPEYAGAVNPDEGRLVMGMVPGGLLIPVLVPAVAPVPAPVPAPAQVQVPNPEPRPVLRNRHLIENLQELIREAGAGRNGELAGRIGEVPEDDDEDEYEEDDEDGNGKEKLPNPQIPQVPRVVARNGDEERDERRRNGMMWEMAEMAEMYRVRNAERMRARGVGPQRRFGDERDGLGGDREEVGNLQIPVLPVAVGRQGADGMGDGDGEGGGEEVRDPLRFIRQLRERYDYALGGEDGQGNGNAYGNQNQNHLLPNPVARNRDEDADGIADAAAEREREREMERIRDEEREIHENARRFYERHRLRRYNGDANADRIADAAAERERIRNAGREAVDAAQQLRERYRLRGENGNGNGDENHKNQFLNYPPPPQLRAQSPVAGPPRLEIGDAGEIRGIVENLPAPAHALPAPPAPPAPFWYQPENRLGRRADLVDGGVDDFGGGGQGGGQGAEAHYPPLGRIEYGVLGELYLPPDFDFDQNAGWREIKRRRDAEREMIEGIPMPEEDVFSDEEGGVDGKVVDGEVVDGEVVDGEVVDGEVREGK
ncbi:hypothetical protein EAF00_010177 [Botryotinia globosa]|nr:hypothetical protein EAF00_010177 [Botryotinia globosa]